MNHRVLAFSFLVFGLAGCATKDFVREEVAAVNKRLEGVQAEMGGRVNDASGRIGTLDTRLASLDGRLKTNEDATSAASRTAQEALERGTAAGKLAEGKFVFETALTDDKVHFGFGKAVLSADAKAALDTLVDSLRSENRNVFLEIQGHTDKTGPAAYNVKLGEERALLVRHYLHTKGVALHRMDAISYGSASPAADNKTRQGRAENRRVVVVVLK